MACVIFIFYVFNLKNGATKINGRKQNSLAVMEPIIESTEPKISVLIPSKVDPNDGARTEKDEHNCHRNPRFNASPTKVFR